MSTESNTPAPQASSADDEADALLVSQIEAEGEIKVDVELEPGTEPGEVVSPPAAIVAVPVPPVAPPPADPVVPPVAGPSETEQMLLGRVAQLEQQLLRQAQIDDQAQQLFNTQELERKVTDVKARLKTAYENGDTAQQVELGDQLADLRAEVRISKMATAHVRQGQPPAQPQQPMQPQQQTGPTPLAVQWVGKNGAWFEKQGFEDETLAARVIDQSVARAGYSPNTPAYFVELDRRLSKLMPHLVKVGTQPPAPPPLVQPGAPAAPAASLPVAPVRPAPAAPAGGGRRVVTLVRSDIDRMYQLGMNPKNPLHVKRYAEELSKASRPEANDTMSMAGG